jgi:hypothetical protein
MKIRVPWYGGTREQSPSSTMAKEKGPHAEINLKLKLFK